MPEPPATPRPPRFQGLDPAALAGVLSPVAAPPPEVPGWEIGEPLGEGGLGTVWLGRRLSDGATAAIKVPRPGDVALVERLEVEATALRTLDHPHIVRLLETGPLENGSLYLALEYIDGPTLAHALPAPGYPVPRAATLFRQIAAAVIHAHSRGVLHRDLKPGNILLDSSGNARVADFGLAHSIAGRVQRLSLTLAGHIAGTAEYLPPEAYHAGYVPAASADIYALGVILHELLAGHPPRGAWQPISLTRADVDIRLDDLLRRALAPDPALRFPTAAAMLAEFDHILRTPARHAGTPRLTAPIRCMDFLWTLLGLFLFLGALGLVNRIEKYDIGLPVDLVGRNTIRIGTYQALFLLLACAVPFGLWQLLRLWRFRRVPLRESLPAPFGLKLGTTRTAGAVVLLSQLLFLLAPGLMGAYAWRQECTSWLTDTAAPWNEGLVITEGYRGMVAHDPWAWPEEGKEYSLRERSGWITDPRSRQFDHTNFIPGLIPRLVVGLALFSASVAVLTLAAALACWWRYRKWGRALALLALLALTRHSVQAALRALRDGEQKSDAGVLANKEWVTGAYARLAGGFLHDILAQADGAPFSVDEHLPLLGPRLICRDEPAVTGDDRRAALARYAAHFRTPHRHVEGFHSAIPLLRGPRLFGLVIAMEDCTDPPRAPATAAITIMAAYATMEPPYGIAIQRIDHQTHPLWVADPIPLPPEDAHAWATALLTTLQDHPAAPPPPRNPGAEPGPAPSGPPDPLAELFYPTFSPGADYKWAPRPKVTAPATRDSLLETLLQACDHGARPRLLHPPGPAQSRPGGRRRITLDIEDRGLPATWTADLIHTAGRWQCVHMAF